MKRIGEYDAFTGKAFTGKSAEIEAACRLKSDACTDDGVVIAKCKMRGYCSSDPAIDDISTVDELAA